MLLVSRSEDKLRAMADKLRADFPALTFDHLAFDFTELDPAANDAFYAALARKLEGLGGTVGVLINNVGIANEDPDLMLDVSQEQTEEILRVNVFGTVRVTRAVLPFMLRNQKGAIVFVSSASGNQPTPMLNIYGSSKSFVSHFAETLGYEYEDQGIDSIVITPFYFVSGMYRRKSGSILAPVASVIAKDTIPLIGVVKRTFPYWAHAVMDWVGRMYWDTPRRILKMYRMNKRRLAQRNMDSKAQAGGAKAKTS